MVRKLKVQELTKKAFAGCGQVVEIPADHTEGGWDELPFPIKLDAEAGFMPTEGEIQILAVTVAERPLVVNLLERHRGTHEMVIPLGVSIWLPVAPPSEGEAKPDLDTVAVFEVQPHQAVICKPGAWHFAPFTTELGTTASLLALYNCGTTEEDVEMVQLDEVIEVVPP